MARPYSGHWLIEKTQAAWIAQVHKPTSNYSTTKVSHHIYYRLNLPPTITAEKELALMMTITMQQNLVTGISPSSAVFRASMA